VAIQRTLEMDFSTQLGKTQRVLVYEARENLTAAEINTAMNTIVSKNIFSGSGGELTGKTGARVVIRDVNEFTLA